MDLLCFGYHPTKKAQVTFDSVSGCAPFSSSLTCLRVSPDVDSQHLQGAILAAEFQGGKTSTTRLEVARGSPASPDTDVLTYATETGKLLADFGQPSSGGSEEPFSAGRAHEVYMFF